MAKNKNGPAPAPGAQQAVQLRPGWHTVRDIIRALGAEAERAYGRFLEMWGVENTREWDEVTVKVVEEGEDDRVAGVYCSVTDRITIYLKYLRKDRFATIRTLIHELAHRAVEIYFPDARRRDLLAPHPCLPEDWGKWWATREELVCELTVTVAEGHGRIERGAMRELARRIFEETSAWRVSEMWRHTRWGDARAAGVTRRGLITS